MATPMLMNFKGIGKLKPNATFKLTHKNGRALGFKVSEDSKGRLILSMRELNGKKLLAIPLGYANQGEPQENYTHKLKTDSRELIELRIDPKGTLWSNVAHMDLGPIDFINGDNKESSQGLFSFLGSVLSDIGSSIIAGIAWLTGGGAIVKFSWGGTLRIYPWTSQRAGDIVYSPNGGFKLEPGLEEDPTVWY